MGGLIKQTVIILIQLFVFRLLADSLTKLDFDSYILLLGVFTINNSLYSIIINSDSVFIIEQGNLGGFTQVILGVLLTLLLFFIYLNLTTYIFEYSAYFSLKNYGYKFLILLILSLVFDSVINRGLFFMTTQKRWIKIWLIEMARPTILFVILFIHGVESLIGFITVYTGVVLIQFLLMVFLCGFQKLIVDNDVLRKRVLGYSVGSVHFSQEREWFDTEVYGLLPNGMYGSYGVLLQFSTLFKSLNRLLNRYFMKDMLCFYREYEYRKLLVVSVKYVMLLFTIVIAGYILFYFLGDYFFSFMKVDVLPLTIITWFFVLLGVESLANPFSTLMLGVDNVHKLNLVLLGVFMIFRHFGSWVSSLEEFLQYFVIIKLSVCFLGYLIIYYLQSEKSNIDMRL